MEFSWTESTLPKVRHLQIRRITLDRRANGMEYGTCRHLAKSRPRSGTPCRKPSPP